MESTKKENTIQRGRCNDNCAVINYYEQITETFHYKKKKEKGGI
jgi:hypothetical protein